MDPTQAQTTPEQIPEQTRQAPIPSEVQAPESVPAPAPDETASDFFGLSDDGELVIGEDFYKGVDEGDESAISDPAASMPEPASAAAPAFYRPEDLHATPLDQLDESRLPEAVRPFYPIVRDQILRVKQYEQALLQREAQVNALAAQMQQQAPQAPQKSAAETHRELAKQATKMAAERLGIEENDIDAMDPEHVAVITMCSNEIATVQRERVQAQSQFAEFGKALTQQPDFSAFNTWVETQSRQNGRNLSVELEQYAQQTGDYAGVQQVLSAWYQMYRQGQKPQAQKPAAPQQKRAAPQVPVVESGGGMSHVNRSIDLRAFSEMDSDEQAKALLSAGLV
jgi:hypothetical protein